MENVVSGNALSPRTTPAPHLPRRAVVVVALLALVVLAWRLAFTPPPRPAGGVRLFDADLMADLEQEAWEAYYLRQWPRLFDKLLRITQHQFGLAPAPALYAAALATRAQVSFAQHGAEGGDAQRDMETCYRFVKDSMGGSYDPARAAELEVRWWVIHRQRDQYPDDRALVGALADLYAEVYQVPAERMMEAAAARAGAMRYSDQWITEGKQVPNPLLGQVRDALRRSYHALNAGITGS